MLQPAQLGDVSARYAEEIAEVRTFLSKAGVPIGTPEVLGAMADRLQRDRAFHRDLTSHLWVIIDGRGKAATPADMLGLLAIAAAGPRGAAAASEDDAHDLLRFVMDARRSLGAPLEQRSVPSDLRQEQRQILRPDPRPGEPESRSFPPPRPTQAPVVPIQAVTQAEPVPAQVPPPRAPVESAEAPFRESPATPAATTNRFITPSGPASPLEQPLPVPRLHRASTSSEMLAATEDETETDNTGSRTGSRRRRTAWLLAAACLVLAVLTGLWLRRGATAVTGSPNASAPSPAPIVSSPPVTPAIATDTAAASENAPNVSATESTSSMRPVPAPRKAERPPPTSTRPLTTARPSLAARDIATNRGAPATQATLPKPSAGQPALQPAPHRTVSASPPTQVASNPTSAPAPSNAAPILRSSAPAVSTVGNVRSPLFASSMASPKAAAPAIPASALTKSLGTPSVPAYAADDNVNGHPKLLRRHKPNTLVAEVGDGPTTGSGRAASAGTATGTVRPTSLGIMAGNLLYSPVPPYPAAAFAAHVQGEVRVSATIDTRGNVAEAHVVSGPPLLRDAALDAVQQWRYKPYNAGGKPVSMSGMAVVEFLLP